MKKTRIEMRVSIAGTIGGRDFSAQPHDIVDVPADVAAAWIRSGHAVAAPQAELTSRDLSLADLDAETALTHGCVHCGRRAVTVISNRALCLRHARAELG